MKVLVCGGRDYSDRDSVYAVLDAFCEHDPISEVVSGMAKGADTLAVDWARRFMVPVLEYPADWAQHGRKAGPIRNQKMLDVEKPDLVVAFAGGKGTQDMIRRAQKAGVMVYIHD